MENTCWQAHLDKAKELAQTLRCNCDLDSWQPENLTGHSHVCRIHKATVEALRGVTFTSPDSIKEETKPPILEVLEGKGNKSDRSRCGTPKGHEHGTRINFSNNEQIAELQKQKDELVHVILDMLKLLEYTDVKHGVSVEKARNLVAEIGT